MSKVLIVDDSSNITEMIRGMLEANGHEIAGVAYNGLEAFEKYKALTPDVVLMDILMPGMDGMQSIRKILEYDSKAKIVVVTALGRDSLKKEAAKAGAVGFITKPFAVRRLLGAIEVATAPPRKRS
jgi:two-component system, chemotaxis family, chemotaxis protein CheY